MTVSVVWHANCSASSGQHHFDDILKLTGVISKFSSGINDFKPSVIEQSDWSETLKYDITIDRLLPSDWD